MVDVVGGGIYINIYYRYGILPPPDSVLVIVWTVGDEDVFDASSVRLGMKDVFDASSVRER
jgi:hypothetical protein